MTAIPPKPNRSRGLRDLAAARSGPFVTTLGLLCLGALSVVAHAASALLDEVVLVKGASVADVPLPLDSNNQSAATFTVSTAGSYKVVLTDLQVPSALGTLSVAVASSTATATQLAVDGGTGLSTTSQTVTLAPGTYTVQPLATAASFQSAGSFSVQVTGPSGFQPWQDVWAVSAASAPAPAGESILSTEFSVTDGGAYTLTLTDQSFPVALQQLDLIIFPHNGTTPVTNTPVEVSAPINTQQVQLTLAAGNYDLFVVAEANSSTPAGLYSLGISSGSSVAFAATEPVGSLPAPIPLTVAAADTASLQVNDLSYPAALGAPLQAEITEGASMLASGLTPAPFAVTAGTVDVYVYAQPNAGGQGAFAVYATDSAGTLADVAVPVLGSSSFGYAYSPSSALSAVSYQLGVDDYAEPEAFGSLSATLVQHGALVADSMVQTSGVPSTFTPVAGPATILVFPTLAAQGDDSLFGVVLLQLNTGFVGFNTTQGVGALFSSSTVTVPSSGKYVVQATDLGFPASMSNFAVIVTQGQSVAGDIFGGGSLPLDVTASGNYVVNVLAQVGSGANYGLYGVNFSQAVAPTVTLTASPTTVSSGGQTELTWSSTGATSCSASGGWNGTEATSGSQQSAALTATTTFALSCTGVGGTANASAQVTVSSSSGGGGGGALNVPAALVLLMFTAWSLRRRMIGGWGSED